MKSKKLPETLAGCSRDTRLCVEVSDALCDFSLCPLCFSPD